MSIWNDLPPLTKFKTLAVANGRQIADGLDLPCLLVNLPVNEYMHMYLYEFDLCVYIYIYINIPK